MAGVRPITGDGTNDDDDGILDGTGSWRKMLGMIWLEVSNCFLALFLLGSPMWSRCRVYLLSSLFLFPDFFFLLFILEKNGVEWEDGMLLGMLLTSRIEGREIRSGSARARNGDA